MHGHHYGLVYVFNISMTTFFSALLLFHSLPESPRWKSKLTTFIPTPDVQVASIWRWVSLSDSHSSLCRQHATSLLPVSCLVWKSLAADADRVPSSCSHAAHGHPPEGLHSPGLLLGGEASVTQLTVTVKGNQHGEHTAWTSSADRGVLVHSTCPVPRCTPLQRHWAARRARHPMQDSWLSDVAIKGDRRAVLWRCNLQGPGADSRGGLGDRKTCSFTQLLCQTGFNEAERSFKYKCILVLSVCISIVHVGLFSSFRRSHNSSLSLKARTRCESLMEASRQPRLAFTTKLHNSLVAPNPARLKQQPSPTGRREDWIGTWITHEWRNAMCCWQKGRKTAWIWLDLPSKCREALRLQQALIWRSHLFTSVSSVGVRRFTSSTVSSHALLGASSKRICPKALKPNPNHRIGNALA